MFPFKVMVAEAIDITRETYFCILMDRESNGPVLVASPGINPTWKNNLF